MKIILSFHHWSKETSQRLHRYKENDFFSFSQWKHREKLSKRSEISWNFFVPKTAAKKGVWRKHGKTKKTAQKEKKKQQHRKQRGRIDIILKVSTSATQDEFWWEKQPTGLIQYSEICHLIVIRGKLRSYSMLLSLLYGQIVSFKVHVTGTFILFVAGLVCVIKGLRPGNFSGRNYFHLSRWKHVIFSLKWDCF